MVALADIQVVVMAFRTQPIRLLQSWLDELRDGGAAVRYGSPVRGIDLAREQACNRQVRDYATGGRRYLLMIDHDMAPTETTDRILHAEGPLLYCGYVGHGGGRGHWGQGDFGCACCRIDAEVLTKIPKPRFAFGRKNDQLTCCECQWFQRQAAKAGVAPTMVGDVYHLQEVLVRYGSAGKMAMEWPWILEREIGERHD